MRKHFRVLMTAMISMLSIMALCVGLAACGGDVSVKSVSLNKTELTLEVDATETLVATIAPENATNKKVEWDSSNKAAATVDQSGKVTAVAEGTATITVKTKDGGKTATCAVTVTEKASPVAVTGVSLNKNSLTLEVDGEETLIATVAPDNATNKNVTWSSDDNTVATVDEEGKVTAVAEGTATITVKTVDGGFEAECEVTVTEKKSETIPVTGVTLDKDSLELVFGRTDKVDSAETLTATIAPAEATNKNVTWSSSAEAVATVDQNGKVTAVGEGTANITVTTEDGNHTAHCIVIVRNHTHDLSYVSNGTEGHHQECSVCGYTTDVSEHTTHLVSDGESGHHAECSAEGCGYSAETTEQHQPEVTSEGANNMYHYKVCECKYRVQERHDGMLEKKADSEGHWYGCPECSWKGPQTAHTKEMRSNDNEHWYVCTGKYAGSADACEWQSEPETHSGTAYAVKEGDLEHHYTKCDGCKELYNPIAHTPKYEEINSETHRGYCEVCNTELAANEAHDQEGSEGACSKCGYKGTEHEHKDEADAKGYYDGLCNVCGLNLGVFTFDAASGTISAYSGTYAKLRVPAEIEGAAVTAFGNKLFAENVTLMEIIIPDSVTALGNTTFNKCTALQTAIVGEGITKLTGQAFASCSSLESILFKGRISAFAALCFNSMPSTAKVYFSMSAQDLQNVIEGSSSTIKKHVEGFNKQYYCFYDNQPVEDESLSIFAGAWHYDSQGVPTLWELTADLSAQTFVMMNNEKKKIYKGDTI